MSSESSFFGLSLVLKSLAPIFVAVGGLHLVLGLGADVLLGAEVSAESKQDAALDSQNRFYGVAFSLNGVLLISELAIPPLLALWLSRLESKKV